MFAIVFACNCDAAYYVPGNGDPIRKTPNRFHLVKVMCSVCSCVVYHFVASFWHKYNVKKIEFFSTNRNELCFIDFHAEATKKKLLFTIVAHTIAFKSQLSIGNKFIVTFLCFESHFFVVCCCCLCVLFFCTIKMEWIRRQRTTTDNETDRKIK